MISKFIEDPMLYALLSDSSECNPYAGRSPLDLGHELHSILEGRAFAPSSIAGRRLHPPCPDCGSRMIRSRDLRDMCVVCGYLQTQA